MWNQNRRGQIDLGDCIITLPNAEYLSRIDQVWIVDRGVEELQVVNRSPITIGNDAKRVAITHSVIGRGGGRKINTLPNVD